MVDNFAVIRQRLCSFWIVFREKSARLARFLLGFLRPTLQIVLFAIFFIFFGLPLIEKYEKEEVMHICL